MTSIREWAGIVHSSPRPAKRFIVEFRFYCDESYDSPKAKAAKGSAPLEPKCYIVGGFIGNQPTWEKVERRWADKNRRVHVPRYHASHLNAGTWEFDGWSKSRRLKYSKGILRILKQEGQRLHGMACGIHVDAYRRVISPDGQVKMGHPYLVCFNTLVAAIATHLEYGGFAPEDTFSVILDRNPCDMEAVAAFYSMKDDPGFPFRHRLEGCMPRDSEKAIGLQAADYVAYETFRLMQDKRKGVTEMRHVLNTMLGTTGFYACMFDEKTLENNKKSVEAATSNPGRCVIIPAYEWDRKPPRPPRTTVAQRSSK